MRIKFTIFLIITFINPVSGQKFHFGIGGGPNRAYNVIKGDAPPKTSFNNITGASEFLSLEYLLNNRFAIKGTVKNTVFGYDFGVSSDPPFGIICFSHEKITYNYLNYEIAFKNKFKISKDLFFTQSLGFAWMPIFKPFPDMEGVTGCATYGPTLTYYNKALSVQNLGFNSTLGLEYRFLRMYYLTLEINYNKGFKEIDYLETHTTVNSNTYYNKISSYGSYGAVQLGIKLPFPGKWKKDTMIKRKYYSPRIKDTIKQSHRKTDLYNKENKFIGFSIRPLDEYSWRLLYPPSFSLRFLYFVKDKIAVGAAGYYKKIIQPYSQANVKEDKEILGGVFSRYYFYKTKSSLFAELNVTAGFYENLYPALVLIGGAGFTRALSKNISFESSFKFMVPHASDYPLHELDLTNAFIDFGLNYHF